MSATRSGSQEEVSVREGYQRVLKDACREEIEAFARCATGRTLSIVWKCRQENERMKSCLQAFTDKVSEWEYRSQLQAQEQKELKKQLQEQKEQ
ncbi:hypothetical protein SJAG_01140 [Schizosaccharomyces japonicus yFS275]|uniref:COX assembly mitochondrial protein n=1 Tax=Schizosaccharomyces japonicus (strain yFS275 / FY16936) TaxID=402676 RepID=B6JZV0_SCHJY|nr:hypothetical protein SJAG_01140 [Schizosaccharomyces japonicus yFS275]EEB06100.1 hypothetical protein SJAG_01140 [Schizosaccharomyces japonicus yFS275]